MTAVERPGRRAVVTGHRRRGAQRGRHRRRSGRRRCEGVSVLDPITRDGCDRYPLRVAGEVSGFDAARARSRSRVPGRRPTGSPTSPWPPPTWPWPTPGCRSTRTRSVRRRRGHRRRLRRRRVRPARAPAAVGPGPAVRRPVPVDRLVLRGQHRPDLHPRRLQGPLRRGGQRRGRAAWTRSRTPRGTCSGAAPARSWPAPPRHRSPRTRWSASSATRSSSTAPRTRRAPTCPSPRGLRIRRPPRAARCFVVEDEAAARARGADIRAVVAGHAATFTGASRWADSRDGLAHAIRGRARRGGLRAAGGGRRLRRRARRPGGRPGRGPGARRRVRARTPPGCR